MANSDKALKTRLGVVLVVLLGLSAAGIAAAVNDTLPDPAPKPTVAANTVPTTQAPTTQTPATEAPVATVATPTPTPVPTELPPTTGTGGTAVGGVSGGF